MTIDDDDVGGDGDDDDVGDEDDDIIARRANATAFAVGSGGVRTRDMEDDDDACMDGARADAKEDVDTAAGSGPTAT